MIQFNCPLCGERLETDPRNAGVHFVCPACRVAEFPSPSAGGEAPELLGADRHAAPLLWTINKRLLESIRLAERSNELLESIHLWLVVFFLVGVAAAAIAACAGLGAFQ